MSAYRWRGHTPRAEAARHAADAAWEYTQRVNAQRKRQGQAPEAPSPAAGAQSWRSQAIAARIRRPASEGDTP